jgi:SAM-dependent methyltransferase
MEAGQIPRDESPERFDAAAAGGTLTHSEHVGRYRWASQLAAGARVLDAGCGTGYGSAILAATGPASLIAVDVAETAVELTRAALGEDADVRVADVRELPLPDGSVDLVVCFEVIEHLERREQALREFARVLTSAGTLLISSPNRDHYPAGNEHHVYEYTPDELRAELKAHFANVRMYRQHSWLASTLADETVLAAAHDQGADATVHVPAEEAATRGESFTVAAAGQGDLPALTPRVVLGDPFEVRWFAEQLEYQRGENERLSRAALQAERELASRAERLRALGAKLLEAEQVHAELVSARGEAEAELEDMARFRAEAENYQMLYERSDRVVADLQSSISWKLTAPLRALKRLLDS